MCYLVVKAYNFKIKLIEVIKYNTQNSREKNVIDPNKLICHRFMQNIWDQGLAVVVLYSYSKTFNILTSRP